MMNIRLIDELIGGRPLRESGKYRKNEIEKAQALATKTGRVCGPRPIIAGRREGSATLIPIHGPEEDHPRGQQRHDDHDSADPDYAL